MDENVPRKRWGSGFMWGCLTPILLIGLLVVGAFVYGGYYVTTGYKGDATFQAVMAAVQSNPIARSVLGDNIAISGLPTYSFRYDTTGHNASYAFAVQGSRAAGHVTAFAVISGAQVQIKTLVLTGPDGRSYNLIGHMAPGAPTHAVWLWPAKPIPQPA